MLYSTSILLRCCCCSLFPSNGCYLFSGSTDGCVRGWNLAEPSVSDSEGLRLLPFLNAKAHEDAVNGCWYVFIIVSCVLHHTDPVRSNLSD